MRAVVVISTMLMFFAALACARTPALEELDSYTFEQYVRDFKKPYAAGSAEYEKRRALFTAKLAEVQAHNRDPTKSWKKGINQMSDNSHDEFAKRLGGKATKMTKVREELAKMPHVKQYEQSGRVLPRQVDWRNRVPSIFSAIKDQGQCGSCWAHGSTETLESHWALATGQLFALSQQQITACAPNPNDCGGFGGCEGSTAELAYTYVARAGIAEEWTYPYTAYYGTTGTCRSSSQITPTDVNVTGYTSVTSNSQEAVMDALASRGPLVVNVDASQWSDYHSGVYDGCSYNISIDHVVQMVGYGTDASTGKDYWIIRNSWSPAWGEQGYIRLVRHSTPQCGWDVNPQDGTGCNNGPNQLWACGQCGVLYDTLFPNVGV